MPNGSTIDAAGAILGKAISYQHQLLEARFIMFSLNKLYSWVFVLLISQAFAMSAHATIIYGTATGIINSGSDNTGTFGLAGASVRGEGAVVTFQIDTSLAPAGSTGNSVSSDFTNNPAIGMISAVSMTLNDVTRTMRPVMPIFKESHNNRNIENISVINYTYDKYTISTVWQSAGWDENDIWHFNDEQFVLNIKDTTATMFSDLSLPTSYLDLYPSDGQLNFSALHRDESIPFYPGWPAQESFSLGMSIDHLILSVGDATPVPEPSTILLLGSGLRFGQYA